MALDWAFVRYNTAKSLYDAFPFNAFLSIVSATKTASSMSFSALKICITLPLPFSVQRVLSFLDLLFFMTQFAAERIFFVER